MLIVKLFSTYIYPFNIQVAPAELEDLLRTMSGVKDVAVIGIPNKK